MPARDRIRDFVRSSGGVRWLLLDVLLAGLVAVFGITPGHHPVWLVVVTGGLLFGTVLVRRRWPFVLAAGAILTPWLAANLAVFVVALYTLTSRRPANRWTWLAVVVVVVNLGVETKVDWAVWKTALFGGGLFVVLPLLAGLWMHQRARLLTALRDRAEQAERERDLLAGRAVAAERRRIAGEMHDVVAHRVGVIAVHAGGLTVTAPDPRVGEVAEIIRQNSTAALAELRDVLRVLRGEGDESAGTTAPPGIAGVRGLVADASAVGVPARLTLPDPMPEVPVPVGRATYRVVQEALTNIRKHAPGAATLVRVGIEAGDLVVEIANDRATGAPSVAVLPGAGYGLVSMRERVGLAGGTVEAGPTPDGGYRVRATFPVRKAAAVG